MRRPTESTQYTSFAFQQVLDDHRVLGSIGSVGDAFDNALAESFVDTFKTELIADRVWRTRSQLELAIVEWVAWFNTDRLHGALGDIPLAEFETGHAARYLPSLPPSMNGGNHQTRSPSNPARLTPTSAQAGTAAHAAMTRTTLILLGQEAGQQLDELSRGSVVRQERVGLRATNPAAELDVGRRTIPAPILENGERLRLEVEASSRSAIEFSACALPHHDSRLRNHDHCMVDLLTAKRQRVRADGHDPPTEGIATRRAALLACRSLRGAGGGPCRRSGTPSDRWPRRRRVAIAGVAASGRWRPV